MTALIGAFCVGVAWGVWVTRKLIKKRREIKAILERNKSRNLKFEALTTEYDNGKKRQTEEAGKNHHNGNESSSAKS